MDIADKIKQRLKDIVMEKLSMMKTVIALDEANVMKQGRTKTIRVRIRGGKVQRRKKFATQKGYTIRGGKVVRMSSLEKMHRKRAARRAKLKRRAKMARALLKRRRSLRKRAQLGLK